ncbi:MAG: hypothetical protein KTR25_02205 [Myxococcales bacterium]|nr:hypothetical protein [Myxococcales bacterium]
MAVHIIGESPAGGTSVVVPEPDVHLPGPENAEPVCRFFSPEQLGALLLHNDPIVRAFAVNCISHKKPIDIPRASLIQCLKDTDTYVCSTALDILAKHNVVEAAEPIGKLFIESQGPLAGQLATTLAKIAPAQFLSWVKQKGRLDDEVFSRVTMALAVSEDEGAHEYLTKAMRRSGLLKAERLTALFAAILVYGDRSLCANVLGQAIGESNAEAPGNGVFPGRVAVASLAGVQHEASRLSFGPDIYKEAQSIFTESVVPALEPQHAETLTKALPQQQTGDILKALRSLIEQASPPESNHPRDKELAEVAKRRQGMLMALTERTRDLERLEPQASALFLAAAAQAAALIASWKGLERTSPAILGLSKAMGVEADQLLTDGITELTKHFEAQSSREMRRIHSILVREQCRRASTLQNFSEAITRSGHGAGLINALGESQDDTLRAIALTGMLEAEEDLETAIMEVLDEPELDPQSTTVSLECAEQLGTERLALTIGRRFFELRKIDKALTARALVVGADPRVIPLLKSRAFADEPEEGAWVVLSLVHNAPVEGDLAIAYKRVKALREPTEPGTETLQVELRCDHCQETATYTFERAFIDPEKSNEWGDPAFVGDVVCKACQSQDSLTPTPHGGRVLILHTLQGLQMAREGIPGPTLVTPHRISVDGKPTGVAEALRRAHQRVEESPRGIRPRLERLHLRMTLKRSGMDEDLAAIRELDPHSIEADTIEATHLARQGQTSDALHQLTTIHDRILSEGDKLRLYEMKDATSLQQSIEALLLQLEDDGQKIARHINLGPARERRRVLEQRMQEYMKSQEAEHSPNS